MIKIRLRLLKAFVVVTVLAVIAIAAYLQHPLFGHLPEGERFSRIAQSPNFATGIFRNQIDSPLHTTDQSEFAMWMENIFGEKGNPRPQGTIPAIKTDLKALDAKQDLVIWLSHSSYFVQLGGQRILVDPVFSTNAAPVPLSNVAFDGASIYAADDMPEIDLLLITHDHYDHLDYPSIQALQPKVKQVVTGLGVRAFRGLGLRHVNRARGRLERDHSTGARNCKSTTASSPFLRAYLHTRQILVGRLRAGVTAAQDLLQRRLGIRAHFAEIGRRYGPFDWVALDAGQ